MRTAPSNHVFSTMTLVFGNAAVVAVIRFSQLARAVAPFQSGAPLFFEAPLIHEVSVISMAVLVVGALLKFVAGSSQTASEKLPRALRAICEKSMASRPEDRYASVSELAVDVSRFLIQKAQLRV